VSVAGYWNGTLNDLSDIPEEHPAFCSLSFVQCGNAFVAVGFLAMRSVRIDDGVVDGDRVSFSMLVGSTRRIEFSGLFADSTMQGHYIVRQQGDSVWTNAWVLHRESSVRRPQPTADTNVN
jgi:hypothetical protein